MAADDVVRLVDIKYTTTGADQAEAANKRVSDSLANVGVTSDKISKSNLSVERSFDSLQRKYDVVYRATQQQTAEQTKLDAARKQGLVSDERYAFLQGQIAQGYQRVVSGASQLTKAHEGLDAQSQAAFHSTRSFLEQLLYGAPITQAAAGQIGHLSFAMTGEGGLAGAFSRAGSAFLGLINPTTVAIAGVVALGAAAGAAALQYDRLQVSSQRAITGAGARTGTTVADLNTFVSQNSGGISGSGLSTKEARDLAQEFTKTGEIVVSRLHGMSDAVVGFSNQAGVSLADASKAMVGFATDPKKALDELSKVYGSFDVATRKAVDALVEADDKTGAFQVVIDALGEKSKKAADNMGFLEKAGRGIVNVLSIETTKPVGLEGQLAAAQSKLAQQGNGAAYSQGTIDRLKQNIADLQAAIEKVNTQRAAAELNKLSTAADGADQAIIPQIQQIEALRQKLAELDRAQAAGASSKYGAAVDDSAAIAIRNQIAALQEAQEQSARYNQRVAAISVSWGHVGQSTALALQAMQNQLPVAEAVTGQQRMIAEAQATYNSLLDQGKTAIEAEAVASLQLQTNQAQATANVERQVEALRDQTAMIQAQANGTEAATAAAIAYKNAIEQGASATAAAALSAETLANYVAKAAAAQAQADKQDEIRAGEAHGAIYNSAGALVGIKNAWGSDWEGTGGKSGYDPLGAVSGPLQLYNNLGPTSQGISNTTNAAYQSGGINAAITALMGIRASAGIPLSGGGFYSDVPAVPLDYAALFSQADSLYALKNAGTSDKNTQVSNLQDELAWVQSLPETLARDQKVVDLKKSIQDLQGAVDNNTDALNQVALNPLYNGRDALHVGYYHAASGYDGVVTGGIPGVDSVPINIMAQRGERVQVHPVGWQDNVPAHANSNGSRVQQTIINQTNNFSSSGSRDDRLSELQLAQGFGRIADVVGRRR